MRPLDFPLLTDENIGPEVVTGLRDRGCDVRTARDEQLIGRPDTEVLQRAASQQRVVVTHDLAFGRATLRDGATFVGIVYLRPGHSPAEGQTRRRQPHRIDPFQDRAPLAARH